MSHRCPNSGATSQQHRQVRGYHQTRTILSPPLNEEGTRSPHGLSTPHSDPDIVHNMSNVKAATGLDHRQPAMTGAWFPEQRPAESRAQGSVSPPFSAHPSAPAIFFDYINILWRYKQHHGRQIYPNLPNNGRHAF